MLEQPEQGIGADGDDLLHQFVIENVFLGDHRGSVIYPICLLFDVTILQVEFLQDCRDRDCQANVSLLLAWHDGDAMYFPVITYKRAAAVLGPNRVCLLLDSPLGCIR